MLRTLAFAAALTLPILGGCSSMMGDSGSASSVSRDSQGAGAVPGAVSTPGGTTAGTPGDKNPPPSSPN